MSPTTQSRPIPPAIRLRREADNTVYAYQCSHCGGASKVYHSRMLCHCGGLTEAWREGLVIEGSRVTPCWDGRTWDGEVIAP